MDRDAAVTVRWGAPALSGAGIRARAADDRSSPPAQGPCGCARCRSRYRAPPAHPGDIHVAFLHNVAFEAGENPDPEIAGFVDLAHGLREFHDALLIQPERH